MWTRGGESIGTDIVGYGTTEESVDPTGMAPQKTQWMEAVVPEREVREENWSHVFLGCSRNVPVSRNACN